MTPTTIIGEEARGAALRASLAAQAARRRRAARGDHPQARGEAARQAALKVAAAALKARDGGTAAHSADVVLLCRAIADRVGIRGREREDLLAAARLHDLGKLAVPMEIIEKAGPLNDGEWETIRQHTLVGQEILGSVHELRGVAAIVRSCHERYDGAGYPDGLAGEEIPLAARVVFCADAFHAIREDRPYRKGRSAARALAEVRRNSGTQFDPRVVEALDEAAQALRQAGPDRLSSLSAPLRSRRLLALLATMMIGGSTLAAAGVQLPVPFAGSDEPEAPAVNPPRQCGAACVVDLGRLGSLPPVAGAVQGSAGASPGSVYSDFESGRPSTAGGARLGLPGPSTPGNGGGGEQGSGPSEGSSGAPGARAPAEGGTQPARGGVGGEADPAPPADSPVRVPERPVQLPGAPVQVPGPPVQLPDLPLELPHLPLPVPDVTVELRALPGLP